MSTETQQTTMTDGEELIDAIAAQKEQNEKRKQEHREAMKEMGAPAYQDNDEG